MKERSRKAIFEGDTTFADESDLEDLAVDEQRTDDVFAVIDRMRQLVGDERFLTMTMKAMSRDALESNLDFILRQIGSDRALDLRNELEDARSMSEVQSVLDTAVGLGDQGMGAAVADMDFMINNLYQAMGTNDAAETLEYIARRNDMPMDVIQQASALNEGRVDEQAGELPVTPQELREMELIADINSAAVELFGWIEENLDAFFEGDRSYPELNQWIVAHEADIREVIEVFDDKGYTVKANWKRVQNLFADINTLRDRKAFNALSELQDVV